MSQKSKNVFATKYRLEVKIAGKKEFDREGQKKLVAKGKLIDRKFVEDRNKVKNNNEFYVVDEEETIRLMEKRDLSVTKNMEEAKKANVGNNAIVDAIKNIGNKTVETDQSEELKRLKAENAKLLQEAEAGKELPETTKKTLALANANSEGVGEGKKKEGKEDNAPVDYSKWSLQELKSHCTVEGITFHRASKEGRLIELITEHNNKS